MLYSLASEKFSHEPLQCAKKIKCTCLRTIKTSISTINIFHKKFWQRFGPLHGLDSWSGRVRSVGRATPARICCSLSMPHTVTSEKFYHKLLQCAKKKIKCTCWRTLEASIGTITTFTRSWDSTSVSWTDSTTSQTVPGELAERQHLAGVTLRTLRIPSNLLSSPCNVPDRCQTFLWKWWWCRFKFQASFKVYVAGIYHYIKSVSIDAVHLHE